MQNVNVCLSKNENYNNTELFKFLYLILLCFYRNSTETTGLESIIIRASFDNKNGNDDSLDSNKNTFFLLMTRLF